MANVVALGFVLLLPAEEARAQAFTFTAGNLIYNENFSAMGASGTNFIAGWTSNDLSMLADNGSSSIGSINNVGVAGSSESTFGSLADGSTPVPRF